MTDWNIATGEEQPLNRTGIENVQVSGSGVQGTFVGVATPSGASESGLYAADAHPDADLDGDGNADGPLRALGVLLPREILPDDLSNVNQHPWDDIEKQIYEEERTLTGDRAVFIKYGIELVNDDDDTNLTPGEPVYLDSGGGMTQDPTSLPEGALVQRVGFALDPMNEGPYAGDTKDRIFLAVADDVQTAGEATIAGDGAATTYTVAHNLGVAPSRYSLVPTNADAGAADYHVSNVTASDIEVTFAAAPSTDLTFHWEAQR
jgi:hypothetical protein